MNFLARVKLWQWLVFTVVLCNLIWNPTRFSFFHLWFHTDVWVVAKVITGVLVFIPLGPMVWMSWHSKAAVVVTALLAGLCVALLGNLGVSGSALASSAQWWGASVLGLVLTVGFNWTKVWRLATSQVSTYDADAIDHHS